MGRSQRPFGIPAAYQSARRFRRHRCRTLRPPGRASSFWQTATGKTASRSRCFQGLGNRPLRPPLRGYPRTDAAGPRCRAHPSLQRRGIHEARNGLLLRRDIHGLFDSGYVTVTPELHFEVSGQVREEFENGRDYYALHGKQIIVPRKVVDRPSAEELSWHNERIYRG